MIGYKYRIALVIGHNLLSGDKGAVNYKGETESSFNNRIAKNLKARLLLNNHIDVKVFYRDNIGLKGVADNIAEFYPHVAIELHFNSFDKPAFGCESLALDGEAESIKLADMLTDEINRELKIGQRHIDGVIRVSNGGRGYMNLKYIKDACSRMSLKSVPYAIIEPCFANIKTPESEKIFENEGAYVGALYSALMKFISYEPQFLTTSNEKPLMVYKKSPENILQFLIGWFKQIFNKN